MPGPIPKRSEERRRVNKVPDLERAPGAATVRVPPASKDWHPIARDWYRSLRASGQSRYYEPSDWATARALADQLSKMLYLDQPNGAMLTAWVNASRDLLTTEAQRRRVHLELTREAQQSTDDPAAESIANVLAIVTSTSA